MPVALWLLVAFMPLRGAVSPAASAITVDGAPVSTGYNVGSTVILHATIRGAPDASRYAVFADLRYAGTSSLKTVELDRCAGRGAEILCEGEWSIPRDAPTGLYAVTVRVEDRSTHSVVASRKALGFFAYKKRLRITHVALDKTFYAPGEIVRCELGIENLTGQDLRGLRVESSNENYPWISTFSSQENVPDGMAMNPTLGLMVLRESLDIPAHGQTTLPMRPAATAAFLQGSQVAVMGAGGPARHREVPPPEVDRYTIAVWNHEHTELLDMQFSPQVMVRDPTRVLPKPYNRNFTHRYNDDVDFSKYREFYPPDDLSPVIDLRGSRTLYRSGEEVVLTATVRSALGRPSPVSLHLAIADQGAQQVFSSDYPVSARQQDGAVDLRWKSPDSLAPGVYQVSVTGRNARGDTVATAATEIAINKLPSSLMVFCPHEDDEHPWAGLIRAMVEAGLPVHVAFYTSGDVGECERYFDGRPCDPIRAREFGTVRMEESLEALEHIGLKRDQVTFLGLPDGGSGEIWFRHVHAENPFLSIYLAVDHAPYEQVFEQNLAYARDSVIDAVKRLITQLHPAAVATPHPDERHVDHRTANWFTLKACQQLLRQKQLDASTVVLADQAYGSGGYTPAPYQYEKYAVHLSGEVSALKQEMGWIYQSQDGNLHEGSKKTFRELPRHELHYQILDWQRHEGWNE